MSTYRPSNDKFYSKQIAVLKLSQLIVHTHTHTHTHTYYTIKII